MSKTVFRNYNKKAISALLMEVGKERYYCALKDVGLYEMKPISLDGFFVEWFNEDVKLYHRYPSGKEFYIIDVLGFWALPIDGWVRERK
jgi:hypothetical protein